MKTYEMIGYVYEGGVHCQDCAERRFPELEDAHLRFDVAFPTDREGNEVSIYTAGDAMESDTDTCCEDCHEVLWEVES
jgi:hypothetical protein